MSRIINKLAEASGGWEVFLYKTLRGLCKDVSGLYSKPGLAPERELLELIEEAVEILEAYEETDRRGQPDQIILTPVIRTQPQVAVDHGTKLTPTLETKDIVAPTKVESKPKPVSRKLHAKVPVDKDVGGSHGELPMPVGFNLVNRDTLTVTTQNGLELGRGSADGQVRGQGVTGQVTSSGTYRLAFKDVELGAGVIHYEAALVPKPAPPPVLAPKPESESVQHPAIAKLEQGEGI